MELVLMCVLASCLQGVNALDVTNSTVQIVLAICGSLVGIVLIGVLLCCCCIYWYSKKQDLDRISGSNQHRRLRPLRPVRTVAPSFMSTGISMEDFEYLHQQSRDEYAGLPGSSSYWGRDVPCRFYKSRQEISNPLCIQPNENLHIAPPSYNQSELNHQRQHEARINNFLDRGWEPSVSETENVDETKRKVEQPSEHLHPKTDMDATDSEQKTTEDRQTTSIKSCPCKTMSLLVDVPRENVDAKNTQTTDFTTAPANISTDEFSKITKSKSVRVINVEDSDQNKKIKRISLVKHLKGEDGTQR